MILFQLAGSLLVFAALAAIAVWKCAEAQFLWMFVPLNWVFLLDRGKGNPYKVVGLRRVVVLRRKLDPRKLDPFGKYGIYWIGLPTVEVHKFPFRHERVNQKLGPDSTSDEWIETDPASVETDHLLNDVIHWVKVPGVEFMKGQRADLLIKYEALIDGEDGARTAVYIREGKFYDALNSIINSSVISSKILRKMEYGEFIRADKDEDSVLCREIEDVVNKTAGNTSGYVLKIGSLAVIRFDASSTAEAKLARLKVTARIQAEAARIRAKGEVADVTELIKMIKKQLPNADETTIIEEVSKLGVAHRYANSKNLQAVGGGAVVGLQPDGKSGNKRKGK